MDVTLVRRILDETPMEDLRKYLEAYNSDAEKIQGMTGTEMLRYMATRPRVPFADEYAEALKIRRYNLQSGNLTGYDCPICRNKGQIMDILEDGSLVVRLCSCRSKRSIIQKANQSNLGDLLKKRFSNFQAEEEWQKSIVKIAKDFVADGGKGWLAMLGQTGCGKTHLCSAVANQLLGNGRQVLYMLWTTEIRQLKRLATDPQYDRIFDQFRTAEVLYIDDLFKGKVTDADVQACYDLLNFRYNDARLTTILSSELSLKEIGEIDGAIAGRIRERCGKNFVTVAPDPAKNWRLKDGL